LHEAAHRRNARAGGHQDGISNGLVEDEVSMRSMNLDGATDRQVGQVGQIVGKEALLDAVHAKLKFVAVGRRGQRVGAGLQLAVGVQRHTADKLARRKGKAFQLVEDKAEVVALGNF
jgi:hypothetical protein